MPSKVISGWCVEHIRFDFFSFSSMAIKRDDLTAGTRVRGLVAAGDVTLVAVDSHGENVLNIVYRADDGQIGDRLVTIDDLATMELASVSRWSFDAPGAAFKLASEARRIQLAHLFDPYSAVATARIQALPHQIEAVYEKLLPMQPAHFLLADVTWCERIRS